MMESGSLRNEAILASFPIRRALQRPRFRRNLIAGSRRQHEEISAAPLTINGIARLRRACVDAKNVLRLLHPWQPAALARSSNIPFSTLRE